MTLLRTGRRRSDVSSASGLLTSPEMVCLCDGCPGCVPAWTCGSGWVWGSGVRTGDGFSVSDWFTGDHRRSVRKGAAGSKCRDDVTHSRMGGTLFAGVAAGGRGDAGVSPVELGG